MADTKLQEWAEELAALAREEHGPSFLPPQVILNAEDIAVGRRAKVKRPIMDSMPGFRTVRGGIQFKVSDG